MSKSAKKSDSKQKPVKTSEKKPDKKSDSKTEQTSRKKSSMSAQKKPKPADSRESKIATPHALAELLKAGAGFDLSSFDARSTPGFEGGKKIGKAELAADAPKLSELQERLWAAARGGDTRSVLLILQGMDTSGKGGIVRHVIGSVEPQGVALTSFKSPTKEELSHDFLWRIRRALPEPGQIGVFDRSQYEDVLIVRVENLAPRATWARRYSTINRFEASLVERGTTVIKVMLAISKDEQRARLAERLSRPDKYWKYNPHDLTSRAQWDDYMAAYQDVLIKCSTEAAPWFVVPADRKWYARWAVQSLLLGALSDLDPQWPPAEFDVAAEQARLAAL